MRPFAPFIPFVVAVCWLPPGTQAQEGTWQADLRLVQQLTAQRPGVNYDEEQIPPYQLPDPLRAADGSTVRTAAEWQRRRTEILELFRTHVYGRSSGRPEHVEFRVLQEDPQALDGAATLKRIAILSRHAGREHRFELIVFLPNPGDKAVPVFLLLNNRGPENTDPTRQEKSGFWPAEEVLARGYGIAAIQVSELAPDDPQHFRQGAIQLLEGDAADGRSPEAWAALAAWGWGGSLAMDYFETDPRVNSQQVAVLGHSRGGKASLWAGAEDQRFALVISNDSGCGGAALSRRRYGETVRAVNRFTHWFCDNFDRFNDREDELPLDQHMLIALIAPRAVYVASADQDLWADPRGEFLALAHASPVYRLWNHAPIEPDAMPALDQPLIAGPRGYHVRSGGHNLTPADWRHFMDFADRLWRAE